MDDTRARLSLAPKKFSLFMECHRVSNVVCLLTYQRKQADSLNDLTRDMVFFDLRFLFFLGLFISIDNNKLWVVHLCKTNSVPVTAFALVRSANASMYTVLSTEPEPATLYVFYVLFCRPLMDSAHDKMAVFCLVIQVTSKHTPMCVYTPVVMQTDCTTPGYNTLG